MRFGRRFCRRSRVLLYTLPHADRAYTLTPTLQSCWLILQSHAYWVILGHTGTNTANVQGGAALFKGTVPALVRQTTYTSIVMVCFPKVKTAIARDVRPRMPLYFISFVSFFFVEMPSPPPSRTYTQHYHWYLRVNVYASVFLVAANPLHFSRDVG